MTLPPKGTGPWGASLRYWLPRRDMRQSDLARATGITPKTISSIVRGFHTTTNNLARIAWALDVPLDQLLVSPDQRRDAATSIEHPFGALITKLTAVKRVQPDVVTLVERFIDHILKQDPQQTP